MVIKQEIVIILVASQYLSFVCITCCRCVVCVAGFYIV